MSGIVGSINTRGSGLVNLGSASDGQLFTGTGVGLPVGFEAAAGGGKMLNAVATTVTSPVVATTTSYATVAGMTVDITPSADDSRILVSVSWFGMNSVGVNNTAYRILRDATIIFVGDASSSRQRSAAQQNSHNTNVATGRHLQYLDSPATTAEITYSFQWIGVNGSPQYLNRTAVDNDTADYQRGASQILAIEVGA